MGAWLAVPGLLLGGLLFIFNIATFPDPPDVAGLVDVSPLVGLWYLVVFVRLGAVSILTGRLRRRSSTSLGGIAGSD